MTMKEKLKHCPFCGGEASLIAAWQREDGTYYPARCGCSKCGVGYWGESYYGHDGFATEEDYKKSAKQAVSKWNTRTPEDTQADMFATQHKKIEQLIEQNKSLQSQIETLLRNNADIGVFPLDKPPILWR